MNVENIISTAVTVLTAVGGFETVKWWISRKSDKRMNEAKADIEEVKAEHDEFALLREHIEFLQEQLNRKEERFAEQTQLVRKLNTEVLELTRENEMLKTERSLKLCERRNCKDRQPQSGY